MNILKRWCLAACICLLMPFGALGAEVCSGSVADLYRLFASSSLGGEWLPVASETTTLRWKEATTASGRAEGIRTFSAYENGAFVGSISFKGHIVSGQFSVGSTTYYLSTTNGRWILASQEEHVGCGNTDTPNRHEESMVTRAGKATGAAEWYDNLDVIRNDGVLRVYRLVLFVSNHIYNNWFHNNVDEVKTFWANAENALNEYYMRDIGVKFVVLRDEKFIARTAETDLVPASLSATQRVYRGTDELNKLIGEDAYDIGMFILPTTGDVSGMAILGGAYRKIYKGASFSVNSFPTMAHELGHMFGSQHTHYRYDSYNSEEGNGQSVMSYGVPRTFFSLVSIREIRQRLSEVHYYSDEARENLVNVERRENTSTNNFPFGISTKVVAPEIDTVSLRREYTIPAGTFFQFHVPVKDAAGKKLLYAAQNVGKNLGIPAIFYTFMASADSIIRFEDRYQYYSWGSGKGEKLLLPKGNGTYEFGLSASNPDLTEGYQTRANHAVGYAYYRTKLNIRLDLKPFVFSNRYGINAAFYNKSLYKGGDKVTIYWDVDQEVFQSDSKVRILLSDDFGQTFKYVLADDVPNNGQYEVTLSNVKIGKVSLPKLPSTYRGGVIKIEVKDHIVYALSHSIPFEYYEWGDDTGQFIPTGGFEVALNPNLAPFALTGITNHPADDSLRRKIKYYTLTGQPVEHPTKGIYITDEGKKVVFK